MKHLFKKFKKSETQAPNFTIQIIIVLIVIVVVILLLINIKLPVECEDNYGGKCYDEKDVSKCDLNENELRKASFGCKSTQYCCINLDKLVN
jgi:hypothetical protein